MADALAELEVVPLDRAVLCVNCESITAAVCEGCPVCGSPSLMLLARVLEEKEEEEQ